MTHIILGFALAAASLTSCNNNNATDTKQTQVKNNTPATSAVKKLLIQPLHQPQQHFL